MLDCRVQLIYCNTHQEMSGVPKTDQAGMGAEQDGSEEVSLAGWLDKALGWPHAHWA